MVISFLVKNLIYILKLVLSKYFNHITPLINLLNDAFGGEGGYWPKDTTMNHASQDKKTNIYRYKSDYSKLLLWTKWC